MTEHAVNMETLNVVHQVLKGVALAISTAARVDLQECATLMQSFAAHPGLDARATAMLLDLAEGLDVLANRPRQ